jgi:NAD-dependent dihydropyrimidine dehydrogenase PreA subunit
VGTSSRAPVDRQRYVAVVEEDCTGCNTCVDYCLVDCIEPAVPSSDHRASHPIRIREDECIGCFVCAKVCEELAVNAIRLVPTAEALCGLEDRSGRLRAHSPIPNSAL